MNTIRELKQKGELLRHRIAKLADGDQGEGVWRTVRGRRIFIKKGQSFDDALKQSLERDIADLKGIPTIKDGRPNFVASKHPTGNKNEIKNENRRGATPSAREADARTRMAEAAGAKANKTKTKNDNLEAAEKHANAAYSHNVAAKNKKNDQMYHIEKRDFHSKKEDEHFQASRK